jgi:TolA-binding protein
VPADSTAAEFRAAVALLDAGRSADAATALRAFVARHAADPRAEDASYLLVLALQRVGDSAAVREAARAYLGRYPDGFRRAQVEPLGR